MGISIRERISLVGVLSILTLVVSPDPGHSIFGLSKCERTIKELKDIETKFYADFKGIRGTYHTQNIQGYDEKIFILMKESIKTIQINHKRDPIATIWKLSYNNKNCFTNTQKLRIKELKSLNTKNFLDMRESKQFMNLEECKGAGSIVFPRATDLKKCFIADVTIISTYKEYKSLLEH